MLIGLITPSDFDKCSIHVRIFFCVCPTQKRVIVYRFECDNRGYTCILCDDVRGVGAELIGRGREWQKCFFFSVVPSPSSSGPIWIRFRTLQQHEFRNELDYTAYKITATTSRVAVNGIASMGVCECGRCSSG